MHARSKAASSVRKRDYRVAILTVTPDLDEQFAGLLDTDELRSSAVLQRDAPDATGA